MSATSGRNMMPKHLCLTSTHSGMPTYNILYTVYTGEQEKLLSLPVTVPDRPENEAQLLAKHQLGFLENVVGPLFTAIMELADEDSRAKVLSNIRENREAWRQGVDVSCGR
eukprot:1196193-Prorocentrum_minimum.AAC.3